MSNSETSPEEKLLHEIVVLTAQDAFDIAQERKLRGTTIEQDIDTREDYDGQVYVQTCSCVWEDD